MDKALMAPSRNCITDSTTQLKTGSRLICDTLSGDSLHLTDHGVAMTTHENQEA